MPMGAFQKCCQCQWMLFKKCCWCLTSLQSLGPGATQLPSNWSTSNMETCLTRKAKQAHIYYPQHVNRYMKRPAIVLGLLVHLYDKEGKASTHLPYTARNQIYERTCGCPGAVCVVAGRRPAAPDTERRPATAECTVRWPLSEWGAGWRSVTNQHTYISTCIHCSCSAHCLFEWGGFNSITIFKSFTIQGEIH